MISPKNPVYKYLLRRDGEPSNSKVALLSPLVTLCLALAALIIDPMFRGPFTIIPAVLTVLGLVLALAGPPVAFMVTAVRTGNDASGEAFSLLLLTDVTSQDIVNGYIQAARSRLHVLEIMGLSVIPGVWLGIAHAFIGLNATSFSSMGCTGWSHCTGEFLVSLSIGSVVGFFALILLAILVIPLIQLAVDAGVWVGLRWRQSASAAAGIALIAAYALLSFLLLCPLMIAIPVLSIRLAAEARRAARNIVVRRGSE